MIFFARLGLEEMDALLRLNHVLLTIPHACYLYGFTRPYSRNPCFFSFLAIQGDIFYSLSIVGGAYKKCADGAKILKTRWS